MKLQKLLPLGVALALVLSIAGFNYPKPTVIDNTNVDVGAIAQQVYQAVQGEIDQRFGASSGPAIVNDCEEIGGVQTCYRSMSLSTATNTPCRLPSPNATSTLVRSTLRIGVGSSTASAWDLSKGTTAFATSTGNQFQRTPLASGAQGTFSFATSTTATGAIDQTPVFAPNTWVVWSGMGFTPADTAKFTGRCEAVFQVI